MMELTVHRYLEDSGWDKPVSADMDGSQTLVVLFASPRPSEGLRAQLSELHTVLPTSSIIGCSSSGEIYGEELTDQSIVVAVMRFAHTQLKLVHTPISDATESAAAGKSIADQLQADDLAGVFTLTDGLLVNGSTYVAALGHALGKHIVVTGGLAGDGDRFEKTWVYVNGAILPGQIAAVGFYGQRVKLGHGSRGGWDLLGPEREVTHSDGSVLYSLDNQPALQVYKKYLGERAEGLPATGLLFPLAIRNQEEADGVTVRTILAVNEDQQSITFAGDVPEGRYVKLMRANFDRLVDGAANAAEKIRLNSGMTGPAACISISCVGRRLVLGPRVEEELEAVLESFPEFVSQVGYYSYGEISPLASGRCDLHNQTMTLTLIWEE